MSIQKKIHLMHIELYWWIEHRRNETIARFGYRKRKLWEHKYVDKFKESIYGEKL